MRSGGRGVSEIILNEIILNNDRFVREGHSSTKPVLGSQNPDGHSCGLSHLRHVKTELAA